MTRFLVLIGDVADVSLVYQQLGLRSFADLRIKSGLYLDPVQDVLPNTCKEAHAVHVCLGTRSASVEELSRALDRSCPTWRLGCELILYPLALYFLHPGALDSVLSKLCSIPFSARLRHGDQSLLKLDSKALLEQSGSSHLSDLAVDSDQNIDAEVINLNSAMGLFEVATTQTATRNFNTFTSNLPYIIKRTSNVEKGEQEYAYLREVPESLRAYFPQVGRSFREKNIFAYEIEFVPMLDLGRFWVHNSLQRDLPSVLAEIREFRAGAPRKKVGKTGVRQALTTLFVDKLASRLEQLQSMADFSRLQAACATYGAEGLLSLGKRLLERLKDCIARVRVEDALLFSHGDLCLPNILFDRTSSRIKLIDPRGQSSAYLPAFYDACKLSHSIRGRYDFIINGLAHLDYDDQLQLRLRTPTLPPESHAAAQKVFMDWCDQEGLDREMLRLGEASLFLSMLPLHSDFPRRMLQQACVAQNLLDEVS